MLIKNTKTSLNLNHAEPVHISKIIEEVKEHGFYSAYCDELIQGTDNKEVLISEIRHMASKALLRVTFNADKTICIFED